MRENFERSLKAVLAHEGGYVHHEKDPGGETNRGVTKAVYDAYRKRRGLPVRSVKHISDDEVREIYRLQYWNAIRGDELPAGMDYAVFDFAVNSGPRRAAKHFQMALGVVADGIIGEVTLQAAEEASPAVVINTLTQRRTYFLRALSNYPTFGRGWMSRVNGVRRLALAMAKPNPTTRKED